MIVAVPAEEDDGERRVALVPESVARLVSKGIEVRVETGAGEAAYISDDDYRRAGTKIEASSQALFSVADVLVRISAPTPSAVEALRAGAVVVCPLFQRLNSDLIRLLAARRITTIALENLPRTTVAQAMDVLSSQSTVAGYRAVIAAANALAKFFPMLMTPAGTIAPARVLVIGAGVAGLQAIATARRLGALVEAFDVRAAAREEVESLGAKFIAAEIDEAAETAEGYARALSERAHLLAQAAIERALANADVCITTALVPNQRAPILITAEMLQHMLPGSVIVDLAAEQGGNCALTQPGKDLIAHGVTIIGRFPLASEVSADASRMYSRNMEKIIDHFYRDGALRLDFSDEITRRCVVTYGGEILHDDLQSAAEKERAA
jgi:proton-translocating NAD(P)+ transhydrogenase subunit alpha